MFCNLTKNVKMTKKTLFTKFIDWVNHFFKSYSNFIKASILSLLVLTIILLLLTQMDQALTMLVDLTERNWFSIFLSFFFVNALAIALSHYPIYTYYAANLNKSEDYTQWKKLHPYKIWPLKCVPLFVFTTNKKSHYIPDNWANYLRYSLGIFIHGIWIYFIISSFSPNLIFETFPITLVKIISYLLIILPFVIYIIVKERFTKLSKQFINPSNTEEEKQLIQKKINNFYKKLGIWYFFIAIVTMLLFIITLMVLNFSPGGFILLLLTSYAFLFNYLFFRLLRTKLSKVKSQLTNSATAPIKFFLERILFLEKSKNYLLLFNFNFLISVLLIIYTTLASIYGWQIQNGIPILLAFFYFYYFLIANLKKYLFVTKKMNLFNTFLYRIIFIIIGVVCISFIATNFLHIESKTHQLDIISKSKKEISEKQFISSITNKKEDTLFFIASHGGGLKANIWTLKVLNTLQQKTKGKFLNQTIAMSGASGGSLGLALYTGLFKEDGLDTLKIKQKINTLSEQNYTSLDLALTFGIDTYRKVWPLNQKIGLRDRPYYAMVSYQNIIENKKTRALSKTTYREFCAEAYLKTGYFPSLIMNTAGTRGNRGILWSIHQEKFKLTFPYAINLADLENNKTLPFYQAVSTTNRFPFLSPAAKIKGYGHFIDAGAIDNSGLLGCLDLYNYLKLHTNSINNKTIVFVEILNGKTLYIKYLLEKFKQHYKIAHITKNENETDNIIADLKTGLNLDKIPEYLSDYMSNLEANNNLGYSRIFLPHKVTINDVENYLDGTITNQKVRDLLAVFLNTENQFILKLTNKATNTFFEPWNCYEPTLSRHLSKSSVNYMDAILKHPYLKEEFSSIKKLSK